MVYCVGSHYSNMNKNINRWKEKKQDYYEGE